jgi:hypothetical protein
MLIRLIYVSHAVGPQTGTMTHSILKTAQTSNKVNDITGVLGQARGVFLQVLEGERGVVTKLFSRIYADSRHTDLELVHCESITKRRYAQWSMAHVNLADDLLKSITWSEFDPYSESGLLVMERIDNLLAFGTTIEAPVA